MDIEKEIIKLAKKNCLNKKECTINMNELPFFEWEDAYFFCNTTKEYIQEKIKIPYTLYEDIGVKIIFISNAKITQYQELFPIAESMEIKHEVLFSFSQKNQNIGEKDVYFKYYYLTRNNAALKVVKNEYSNGGLNKIVAYTIHPESLSQINY